MKYWGFKSIHGKVWTFIYTSPHPVTATELVQSLDVTKSLMSMVLAELLEYRVIERVSIGSQKSPGYVTAADLQEAVFSVLKNREQRMLSDILEHVRACLAFPLDKNVMQRLKHLEKMTEYSIESLGKLLRYKNIASSRLRHLFRLVR